MIILAKRDKNITLKEHTEDVRTTFKDLTKKIQIPDKSGLKLLIEYSILLHDIGKVLPYFQIKYMKNKNYSPFDVTVNIYHSLLSVLFINQEKLKEKFGDNNMKYLLSAVAYHHWKDNLEFLLRFGSETFEEFKRKINIKVLENNIINAFNNDENIKELIKFNYKMLDGLINGISFTDYVLPPYQLYWLPRRIEIKEEEKKKWILVSGFLQRCDHFASFCEEENEKYEIEIDSIPIEQIKHNIIQSIKNKNPEFKDKNLWQSNFIRDKNKNVILVAPTGCGKTEFAFLWSHGEKLFYTLPFRAAVEQIFDRAQKIFTEEKVGILHSDADVYLLQKNDDLEKLKVYEVSRQLAYPVIISTGDQFFSYGLRPPGYERIYSTFSYSRVVIDEIQAYNPKAAAIIVKFIEDITRLGGKFLLMTATLPEYVRKEIRGRIGEDNFVELNLYENEKEFYSNKIKKHKVSIYEKKVQNEFKMPEEIVKEIIDKGTNNRVIVILNTIKMAEKVYYEILKQNKSIKKENIILFHSQFTLKKKQNIKDIIEEKFKNPKNESDKEGKILIATQVIEASVDIDADYLYTEICPMDALVQRMGRILRRYKKDFLLSDNDEPNIKIIILNQKNNKYESGIGKVYNNKIIEKTKDILDRYIIKDKNTKKRKGTKKPKKTEAFILSEYEKYELVNEMYNEMYEELNKEQEEDYWTKFYKTLDLLDAGFMSDRKNEAHKIFREIMNVPVIDKNQEDEFINKIEEFINKYKTDNIKYSLFKKEILAEFVLNIPYYKAEKNKVCLLSDWIKKIEKLDNNIKKKLMRWTNDIWIILLNKIDNIGENNII